MPSPAKSGAAVAGAGIITSNLSHLSEDLLKKFESKIVAPRNPKLIKTTELPQVRMTPSMYLKEMEMDTKSKLANTHEMRLPRVVELLDMSETTHQKVSSVDIEEAMFQPFPSEIYFQNFEPFHTYEVPLLLRNNDRVPRLVKVIQKDSPYFKIVSPDNVSHKVAPGMASVFKILFNPEDEKDYTHELICMTEREKFIVPVKAIGAHAILDLPDQVNFSICPVKHNSSKTLLVRNIGKTEAKYSFKTESPFTINPSCGSLTIGDSMQVTIEFKPVKIGDHQKDLVLRYDSGEVVHISLYGAAIDANVRLDKNAIRIDSTYISLANQRNVTIHNRSNVIAHFKWSPFATQIEEDSQKERFCNEISDEERQERERFFQECIDDPTLRDRMSILTRTFTNRRNLVKDDSLLFADEIFSVYPLEGDIWPNSTTELTVVFKPKESKSYQRTAFCDITGRETRLPLKIRGDGMGPKLVFSYDSLDIGNVFAGSTHSYEVVLANKGDIDAIFSLSPSSEGPPKGGTVAKNHPDSEFRFDPVEGIVLPAGHQAIEVSFCSETLGDFSCDFYFAVDGSPDQLKINFRGCVIGPTFHFDVPRLRFGTVSYGFVHSKLCTLYNTSLVPMTFNLRVRGDGNGDLSVASASDLELANKPSDTESSSASLLSPREFDVTPAQGTIRAQSEMRIQVSICSNTIKRYDYALVVDIKGVGEDILSLPIVAKSVVPTVQVLTPTIDFDRCFLNHPYQLNAQLLNDSDLPAKYDLLPQIREEFTAIIFGSPRPKGILEPRAVVEVPLLIQIHELADHEVTAQFSIFGSSETLPVQIDAIGEGPVVHITPEHLDWRQTQVLKPATKEILLSNESAIPAVFFAQMMRTNSVWKVDPDHGEIPAHCTETVHVTAILDDCIRFQDKLNVTVVQGPSVTIPVHAYGFGTTLVTDPPLTPRFDLGPHFAKSRCMQKIKLTNRGRRHQALMWSTDGYVKSRRNKQQDLMISNMRDMKFKDRAPVPSPPAPVFEILPSRLQLEPGHSAWVTLEGYCEGPRQVHETLVCHAIIGKANGKEKILKSSLTADFVSPVLELSNPNLYFRVDKTPDSSPIIAQTARFTAKNVSSLPLTCVLTTEYPFQILDFQDTPRSQILISLAMEQEQEIVVWFDSAYKDDLFSRIADSEVTITYKEHPHTDSVKLKGEVNFPNLDFSKKEIDFDCILNDTEVARFVDITNNSPMPVSYRWAFVVKEGEENIKYMGVMSNTENMSQPGLELENQESGTEGSQHAQESTHDETSQKQSETAEKSKENMVRLSSGVEGRTSTGMQEDAGGDIEEQNAGENEENIQDDDNEQEDEEAIAMGVQDSGELHLSLDWSKEDEEFLHSQLHQDYNEQTDEEIEEFKRTVSRMSSKHQPSHSTSLNAAGLPILPWLMPGAVHLPSGIEEVFDILPIYGTLDPGETQRVTFTFYGHADVSSYAKAVCTVNGGPDYDISLKGEASLIEYRFDACEIKYGKQMFDQVAVGEVKLENPGRVGLDFTTMDFENMGTPENPVPGVPVVVPSSGHVKAFSEVVIKVYYLPGLPEKFHKSFEIQVAHFEPTILNLFGEGVFPRLSLDLPRFYEQNERSLSLVKEARETLENETKNRTKGSAREDETLASDRQKTTEENYQFPVSHQELPSELDVQMEAERLLMREFATEKQGFFNEISSVMEPSAGTNDQTAKRKRKFPRVRLTDYLLDFGFVILGNIRSHIVRATNTSHYPISFSSDRSSLWHSGFSVELDRVKQLPGYPEHETVDFKVSFDPRGANLGLGPVEAVVPVNVIGGPQICMRLQAHVTVPELEINTDLVEFGKVQCGQCKVITVQLHNHKQVRCDWTSLNPAQKNDKFAKHLPMHLRRKLRKEMKPKAAHFEMMPARGSLAPGQRMNVQIKFMPTEERIYSQRLVVRISQSTTRISVIVNGEGLEPRLEFSHTLVTYGPILPHGVGDEVDVTVSNPTPFPVEFYSLDFDKQYLFEEKILRMMKGYDDNGNILLPPRLPGDELPPELLLFYQEQKIVVLDDDEKKTQDGEANENNEVGEEGGEETQDQPPSKTPGSEKQRTGTASRDALQPDDSIVSTTEVTIIETQQRPDTERQEGLPSPQTSDKKTLTSVPGKQETSQPNDSKTDEDQASSIGVGELEITPVSASIARHLGIDLSPEGRASRNRRGIAIIVHGPPMSGKTNTSVMLAKSYGAARLTVDGVVLEAISNGNTQAGLRARELCALTARGQKDDDGTEAGTVAGGLSVEAVTAHTGIGTEGKAGAASVISTKKASVISKQAQSTMGSKGAAGGGGTASEHTGSHGASSPPPFAAPIARRLSVSASVAGEEGLMSCVLPEELLIELLEERMQLNDCHHGVIFDGLETLFSPSQQSTTLALLKAINNRKHIYFVTQKLDFAAVKAKQRAKDDDEFQTMQLQEEQEKRLLEEMDEDEYDNLPDEKKEEIDQLRLGAKKEKRRHRELEDRMERQKAEIERLAMAEERQKEEDSSKRKGKGKGKREETGKRSISGKHGEVPTANMTGQTGPGSVAGDKKILKTVVSLAMVGQMSSHEMVDKRPDSRGTDRPESIMEKGKKHKHQTSSDEEMRDKVPDEIRDEKTEAEKLLQHRFKAFEASQRDITGILEFWDRNTLSVVRPSTPEGTMSQAVTAPDDDSAVNAGTTGKDKPPPSGKRTSKKEREKEKQEREKLERERIEKERIENDRLEREKIERERIDGVELPLGQVKTKEGVPHIIVDTSTVEITAIGQHLLDEEKLPNVEEVLDGLGLGPKGPPIPPPATFSVIPYPVKRKVPSADPGYHYQFVSTSPDDPNIGVEEQFKEPSESALGDDTTPVDVVSRAESKKDDHPVPPPSRKGKKERGELKTATGRKSPRRSRRGSNEGGRMSPPLPATPGSEADHSSVLGDNASVTGTGDYRSVKLSHFRWIVPAGFETTIRIKFTSEELGQFDQTLNFEITGTRRRYQLFCRGVCSFPTISREPRVVFPHRRKTRVRPDEPAVKKYVISDEVFEYGPLLCGKTRERYKEGRYPENMERIMIQNTSPLNADVSFCYQRDSNGTTFLLDPPDMFLKPGEAKPLSMWAYPKTSGLFVDMLVCCVRENPEPICFNVACHGVRPEVELDRKHLHFDKVLLHRKETKTLFLRNSTMLPLSWRVAGMENMGDDFSLSQDSGIIEPRCQFGLQMHFRATKAMNLKKTIRLEVSDVENIMGLVQTENVQVTAEAYDVALDMSFPKGADGGLDFGTIRVMEESKQTCSLKNKGRYEIGFCFLMESSAPNCPPVEELFSILPQKGTLVPNDRPTQVQVVFRSKVECTIRDLPLLRCQVIEPNIGDGGEIIASIPIKLTVRSVFSKYNIFPSTDINFGPMLLASKRTRTFSIENKGEFDFKYTITKMVREVPIARPRPMVLGGRKIKSRDGSSSSRSIARGGRTGSVRQDAGANQTRLIVGSFTVYPGFGTILPGGTQSVTVDCVAENLGKSEEFLALDVSDRDPSDQGSGIPYRLLAEGCLPSINTHDLTTIFEEHRICKSLHTYIHNKDLLDGCGVFGEDDNKFLFNNVIVGRKTYARFKIMNTNKVPVDVAFTVKPLSNKVAARIHDIYEVEPYKTQIQPHHFVNATVSFCPPAMNSYGCIFEAAVDGLPSSMAKGRNLFFEITGEGNLPRVTVTKPVMRNKIGDPVLIYQRLLLGREESLPLTLTNEGTLPSKVNIVLEQQVIEEIYEADDEDEPEYSAYLQDFAFLLVPHYGTILLSPIAAAGQPSQVPYTTSVILQPNEIAKFDIKFRPGSSRAYNGQIKITVMDNLFEENRIQLFGEGFQDDVTFDNLYELGAGEFDFDAPADSGVPQNASSTTVTQPEPVTLVARGERLLFGDCRVGVVKDRSFSITNHAESDTVRFQWAEHEKVKFSPTTGHLHPGCSKDVTATFSSDVPTFLKDSIIKCSLSKIRFQQSVDQVTDWDDRLRVVKWIDVQKQPNDKNTRPAKKKIVETEAEPEYSVIEGSSRALDLALWANVNYAKFHCQTEIINFKDTLMFQARVYEVLIHNVGEVQLDFNWQVVMENLSLPRLTSASTEGHQSVVTPRSCTAESTVASVMAEDGMALPFSIMPSEGKILPGKKQYFTVRFAPIEVSEFQARLLCSIPNIEEENQGPVIKLRGRSLMPYCHFDLKDSDYLSGSRRNPELSGPRGAPPGTTLDPNTRVIEFESIGVGIRNIKKFWVMNPTASDYTFTWVCEDATDARITPPFTCNIPDGTIDGGKKREISFEFLPTVLSIAESFWKFVILEQNISMPFLLVGDTKEPKVSADVSHINFKSLLVGRSVCETIHLINDESIGFNFKIIEDSCHSEGYSSSLQVSPIMGFISPKSRMPLQVSYTAHQAGEANFNVICEVSRKTKPLMLNVKACGHSMQAQLVCENSQGAKIELSPAGLNAINFGEVELHEKAVRQLYLINSGKHNFTFNWNLTHDVQIMESLSHRSLDTTRKQKSESKNAKLQNGSKRSKSKSSQPKTSSVSISPEEGNVSAGTRKRCLLTFQPSELGSVPTSELVLKVSDGPTYLCHVTGVGVRPGLNFSFNEYSFGACFIYRAGMPINTTTLTITNKDTKENSIECMYENTPHLEVVFQAVVLAPGASTEANITFYPRAVAKYREIISFQINGLSTHLVDILGEGSELRVEVANPKQKLLKFGALRVGDSVKHIVPIVNKSPIPITLNVSVTPVSQPLHDPSVLYVSPTEPMTLAGKGGSRNISVYFTPKTRIPQFTEEIMMECAGMSQPVFVVSGSCQGIEISLDQDSVPFGAVVQRSCSTRRIMMQNTGDIGAGFRWEADKFAPDFSIEPVSGYISPGMEVSFTVTFQPKNLSQDIRYDNLLCLIEGGKPLKLTLTGMCIGSPATKEIVGFSCHVRGKETRSVMIANRTNQIWRLHPVIDGEYWTGADTLTVDALQTKAYELTYRPLTMTIDGKKHTGSIFFPLPDGNGLLYNLQGQADPPKPVSSISRDIPCKTAYTELLPVANWLRKPQRFKVTVEMIKPDKLDSGTTLKGLDYIDVPGSVKRDYKLHFYAHKEGTFGAKILFRNEMTSEYIFYYVTFRATPPGVISTIELQTPVRRSAAHSVRVENPLGYPLTFQTECKAPDINLPPQFTVPANSEGSCMFEYQPLKAGEYSGKLILTNSELGSYVYDLALRAMTAGPEKTTYFNTGLGSSQTITIRFQNYAKQKTDYLCKIDNNEYTCDRTLTSAPASSGSGTEVVIDVLFEPIILGESRATLTLSSSVGGEYSFPLVGRCSPPRPQGPFVVRAKSSVSVPFKNVFQATTVFTFQVDNPLFSVKAGEPIRTKKTHNISVTFDGGPTPGRAVTGKLTISCVRSAGPGSAANISWIYYLKGITPETQTII